MVQKVGEGTDAMEGFARIAVTKVDYSQDSQFIKNYIRLDHESMDLELFFTGKPESAEQEPDERIALKDKLRKVDTSLQNKLMAEYEVEFGSVSDEVELPDDGFEHPMGLIFEDGEMLLIWTESRE